MGDHLPMVGDAGPIQVALLDWYVADGRDLAIRHLTDPYAIWLAETMSQQTQIGRVGAALPAFLARYPNAVSLAATTVGELLRAWGDLGYPRRALALREAARKLVEHHGGRIPADVSALEELPGVGPYTARAVAATAFGIPVTALDVNARRVLGRVLGQSALGSFSGRAAQAAADALAPAGRAADWNHALMDLGATVCRPTPGCAVCPLQAMCGWTAGDRTVPTASTATPRRVPFRHTNRYVRGRVLASLRDASPGAWMRIDGQDLAIDPERVAGALTELQRDGLVEVDAAGSARLPTA